MTIVDSERLREEARELTRRHRAVQRLLGDLRRMGPGDAVERLHHGVGRGLHGWPAQDRDAKQ